MALFRRRLRQFRDREREARKAHDAALKCASAHFDDPATAFAAQCREIETAATAAAAEYALHTRKHRLVKHLLAYPAIAAAAAATATAFQDEAQVAAWFALAATILTGAQSFQDPAGKEADHQRREAQAERISRDARYLRTLDRGIDPTDQRQRLNALVAEFTQLRGAPYSKSERET